MQNSINPNYKFPSGEFPSTDELYKGIIENNRVMLSRAITLIESQLPEHLKDKTELLEKCSSISKDSFRIGITGVPGAGKSTFIDNFGCKLIEQGYRVAVLAIDPSSSITGGSILGDKTRMQNLAVNPNAFVRPTASGGYLGGTSAYTREVMLLCEAAGYDRIIVETVGVGQNETLMHELCDLFLLLTVAGTGDELQGIKRGVMEMADIIAVNKCDGDNLERNKQAAMQIKNAIHLYAAGESEWITKVHSISSINSFGIDVLMKSIDAFNRYLITGGYLITKRKEQDGFWMEKYIHEILSEKIMQNFTPDEISNLKLKSLIKHHSVYDAANYFVNSILDTYRSKKN